ncbi:MAG: hypothetical protein AABN95_07975 [Acidobacteriota bacterium]
MSLSKRMMEDGWHGDDEPEPDDRPPDEPWPSEEEMRWDADNQY